MIKIQNNYLKIKSRILKDVIDLCSYIFFIGRCVCDAGYKEQLSSTKYPRECILEGRCLSISDCPIYMPECNKGWCNCSDIYIYNNSTKMCQFKEHSSQSHWYYYLVGVAVVLVFISLVISGVKFIFKKFLKK